MSRHTWIGAHLIGCRPVRSLVASAVCGLIGCSNLLGITDPIAATEDGPPSHDGAPDGTTSDIDAAPACAPRTTFGTEMLFPVGAAGVGLAVARLDPGLTLDVAIATGGGVVTLFGDGTGRFANRREIVTTATGVAIDDFNADARNDLIVWSAGGVVAYRQSAANPGTFLAPQPLPGPFQNVTHVVIEPFDPNPDLLVEDDLSGIRLFTSLLGNAGEFSRTTSVIGGATNQLILAANVDGVAGKDVVFVEGNTVKFSPGTGTTLGAPVVIGTGVTGRAVGIGHFGGNGNLDLVMATAAGGVRLLQAGAGSFFPEPGTIAGVVGNSLLVADVNGDAADDVVVASAVVAQCPGDGLFHAEPIAAAPPVALADLNRDGKLDLLRLVGTNLAVRLQ